MKKKKTIILLIFLAMLAVLPKLITSNYIMQIIDLSLVNFIVVMGLNFVTGFAGQISLASTAFWGIGAYTSAILTTTCGFSFWAALPISGIVAMLGGILIGYPTLKLKKFYLGIATIGFGEIVSLIFLNWTTLTKGSEGIPGLSKPSIGAFKFTSNYNFYYVILIIALILLIASVLIKYSRFGRTLLAIRNDEIATETCGINAHSSKMIAFSLSALYAGIAGSLYAHLIGFISPDLFVFRQSISFLCMFMIGGSGYIAGPAIGSFLITLLPEVIKFLQNYYMAIFGILVVILAIAMPTGIVGLMEKHLPRLYRYIEPYAEVPEKGLERGNEKWRGK